MTNAVPALAQAGLEDLINLQLAQKENEISAMSNQTTFTNNLLSPDPRHYRGAASTWDGTALYSALQP
jgi:hypothetical protein